MVFRCFQHRDDRYGAAMGISFAPCKGASNHRHMASMGTVLVTCAYLTIFNVCIQVCIHMLSIYIIIYTNVVYIYIIIYTHISTQIECIWKCEYELEIPTNLNGAAVSPHKPTALNISE